MATLRFAGREPPADTAKSCWVLQWICRHICKQTGLFPSPEEFSVDKGRVALSPMGLNVCGSTPERLCVLVGQ